MTKFKSEFLNVMQERGFLHQATDLAALDDAAAKGVITSYVGFDATADSFHIGNLMQIMVLRWLQKTGHKPIALMGGGTTKIGDPSGKDEVRKLKTDEEIDANVSRLQQTFAQYINFGSGKTDALLVNNAEWLDSLEYVPFLRDVGRHFSINRMLTFDSVRLRLEREQPLSFLEFNYMILQGYDFVELNRRYGCILQTGGADQWGNIVNGVDLGRRISKETLFGLTTNLITLPSGEKMGKSVGGAVWINADRMSAYDYYQHWRNVDDASVTRFLKLFTELPLGEVDRLGALEGSEINEAKKILAMEATALCHGRTAACQAADTARSAFETHQMAEGLPTLEVKASELSGMQIAELAVRAGLTPSKGEARRLIKQGGLAIDDHKPTDEYAVVDKALTVAGHTFKLNAGKKRIVLVKVI